MGSQPVPSVPQPQPACPVAARSAASPYFCFTIVRMSACALTVSSPRQPAAGLATYSVSRIYLDPVTHTTLNAVLHVQAHTDTTRKDAARWQVALSQRG